MKKGAAGPDPKPAAALPEPTRVYPLRAMEKDVKRMQIPTGSGLVNRQLGRPDQRTHDDVVKVT